MTDVESEGKGTERTCIVTRQANDPAGVLIRFVVGPDGEVVPDVRGRLPGRGAWVSGSAAVVDLAVKRKAFQRAFKRDVTVDPALSSQVATLLERDALQALGFANKAGQVVCGAVKVESALAKRTVAGLIHAADGSADGVRKIDGAARRAGYGSEQPLPRLQIFESRQLDLALGRSNVIHAALLSGGVSDAFLARAARLDRFRGAGTADMDASRSEAASSGI